MYVCMYNGLSLFPYGTRSTESVFRAGAHTEDSVTQSPHIHFRHFIYTYICRYIYPHAAQWAALTGRTPACCLYIYVIHDVLVNPEVCSISNGGVSCEVGAFCSHLGSLSGAKAQCRMHGGLRSNGGLGDREPQ